MIPLKLSLAGFLSYRDAVEIDFTPFDLACISGPNGAGKSSLLDAITWALFGQARRRDDALINAFCDTAEVTLTFLYEDNVYRVQRIKPRGKTTLLEFHIRQSGSGQDSWKPLTERTLRKTQTRLERTLRMDYETFTNAAFFLQGKADQFTQQRPGDRKRILGSILGLEVWEQFRGRASERRREVEKEIEVLDGRLQEIDAELAEEQERRANLNRLQDELARLSKARAAQERNLEAMRQIVARLQEQHRLVSTLQRQLQAAEKSQAQRQVRLQERQQERQVYAEVLDQAAEIEAAYQAWQTARQELARWEEIAVRFREHEARRAEPLREIDKARADLEAELNVLLEKQARLRAAQDQIPDLERQLEAARQTVAAFEAQLAEREILERQLAEARDKKAAAAAENPRLKAEMDQIKERIDRLTAAEGATCPLCGQPLTAQDRQKLIAALQAQGTELGNRYRANKELLQSSAQLVADLEARVRALGQTAEQLRQQQREIDRLSGRLEELHSQITAWEATDAPRLQKIQRRLEEQTFAPQARARLAEVDSELKAIGYDAAAHDAARRAEASARQAEEAFRQLEKARAALTPLRREIEALEAEIQAAERQLASQRQEYDQAAADLETSEAQAPDLEAAERELRKLQEEENHLHREVGAAQQKVDVLAHLKDRRQSFETTRQELARQVGHYKQLERAFGKDGVPALLIEQALPQIETKANEILDRLSGGTMSVRFVTQAAYKDQRRNDLKETLDIQISDSAGMRAYEMYSGGEAFRINFAIRLALSEVLAQRAGARLQTLVIDEGFGNQDTTGRQRLIEAINLVRPDFAKILVITHIDELKDAFPTRIEVQKTERGSLVSVI